MTALSPRLLSQASLIYQDNIIFENIDLPLHENQWTGILGPSGAGKTSLLRMIARLCIHGKAFYQCPVPAHDISYMTQSDALLPWLSVLDNILIGPKLRHQKISDTQKNLVLEILENMDLITLKDRKPHQLSGGQQKRAALARTVFENRKIILMDEPFSSLDTPAKFKLYPVFKYYLKNKTVVWVTHDPLEALKLADDIYYLSGNPAKLNILSQKDIHKNYTHLIAEYEKLIGDINL